MKILVVDDEPELLEVMNHTLRDMFDIDTSCNGVEALEKILKNDYDLIITDINMPRMDGNELISNIRKNNIHTDIIVISGNVVVDNTQIYAKFQKPLDISSLVKEIFKIKERLLYG